MAFADPQSLTISGTATSLPRVSSEPDAGTFASSDQSVKLRVSHSYTGRRVRHLVRLDSKKITADPLQANVNFVASGAAYLVVDMPITGLSVAEQKAIVDGLTAFLTASSGSKVTQLLGGEN